jgi:hypothetical protein
MKARGRTPSKIFGRCDYCVNSNKLAEERNAKILQAKRYAIIDEATVIFGIQCE